VYQLNGPGATIKLMDEYELVSKDWPSAALVPYLAYIPEKDRVAMMVLYDGDGKGRMPAMSFSYATSALVAPGENEVFIDDHGTTWSVPKSIGIGGLSLTYLGKGVMLSENAISRDYGETWEALPESDNGNTWLPALVDTDPQTGKVTRVLRGFWTALRKWIPGLRGPYCQARVKSSYDEGKSWQDEVIPKEWLSVNEVTLVRAKNGDIVAACRMDINKHLEVTAMDDYTGMGVSISKDNGKTWSNPFDPKNMLYDFGRHHAWMVCMPDGDIVMTYLIRRGYADSADGHPQFGIEAVVSHDNGKTWDLDHRYVLHTYKGTVPAQESWAYQGSPSNASTAVLPDGTLLTAFNMEYTKIGLVKWKLNNAGLNDSKVISQASFDSDLRNHFNPATLGGGSPTAPKGPINIAVPEEGATLTSSTADINSDLLMEDPYLYSQFPPGVVLQTMPGWVEIAWPKRHKIDEVQILTGDPGYRPGAAITCLPLDYRLEYRKAGKWVDLVESVVNAKGQPAYTFHEDQKNTKPVNLQQFVHRFSPVETDAIRLTVTKSADIGKLKDAADEPTIPIEKRRTFLKLIKVYGE